MVTPLDHVAPRAGLGAEDLAALLTDFGGQLVDPDAADYSAARGVWNAMVDRRPALIARCAGIADVLAAVRFAGEHDLPIAVRGGGHNVAGTAVADGSLVVDLSLMRGIRVDPVGRTARVGGGATWAELDRETQAFGLATTGGTVSSTGVGGLTLGGGFGWLMRKHGLACDNVLSADVVTADGRFLTASATEHADLFWGLRGGGANLGVVTSLEFRLHPVGPEVVAGPVFHPLAAAGELLRFYREAAPALPDAAICLVGLLTSPEGEKLAALLPAYAGSIEEGLEALAPLRAFGSPVADQVGPISYRAVQTMFDAAFPAGLRNYWKSGLLRELGDGAIDAIVAGFAAAPSPRAVVLIEQLGGAVARVRPEASAFPHRDAPYNVLFATTWEDPATDAVNVAWARGCWAAVAPWAEGGVYVNYLAEGEGADRVRAAYGPNYGRLAAVKRAYDPENRFRSNQNVSPAG